MREYPEEQRAVGSNPHLFPIVEIFGPTIQGEGPLAGAVTHFVRLAFCDSTCSWCDTKYSWQKPVAYEKKSTADIVRELKGLGPAKWVTLSGGNPALQPKLGELVRTLQSEGYLVACETQGTIDQDWFSSLNYLILSPKPPSSGQQYPGGSLLRCLSACSIGTSAAFKVVVFDRRDLEFAADLRKLFPSVPFYLQVGCPQPDVLGIGRSTHPDLEEQVENYRALVALVLGDERLADVRVLPQLHLYLFGHGRGV